MIDHFPPAIQDFLQIAYGVPSAITPMYGLSHNRIWRVCFGETCFVVKALAASTESAFYQHVAPALAGVSTPKLKTAIHADDTDWLVLEYIPEKLPRSRWLADPTVITTLYQLHHSPTQPTPDWPALFQPTWHDAMTSAALTFFAAENRPVLTGLQAEAQPLFEPHVWISGDPNPNNWGIRADGTVVLYDWERFGRGTPALDLAITIPGLGSTDAFRAVAAQYGDPTLARQIALAKLWSVIEFLAHAHHDQVADMSIIPLVVDALPELIAILDTNNF